MIFESWKLEVFDARCSSSMGVGCYDMIGLLSLGFTLIFASLCHTLSTKTLSLFICVSTLLLFHLCMEANMLFSFHLCYQLHLSLCPSCITYCIKEYSPIREMPSLLYHDIRSQIHPKMAVKNVL